MLYTVAYDQFDVITMNTAAFVPMSKQSVGFAELLNNKHYTLNYSPQTVSRVSPLKLTTKAGESSISNFVLYPDSIRDSTRV
jgi:hypothetical protein